METKQKHILIADDDPAIVDVLELILTDAGYRVTSTTDGREVTKLISDVHDLVLLDIWMSGVDGYDVCCALKQEKHTRHIPVIMLSANKDGQKIAHKARAEAFIAKPFEMDELLTAVDKFFTNPQ